MKEVNVDLLTYDSLEYRRIKKEYDEAKADMQNNMPTATKLRKLILLTSELTKIRIKIHACAPNA